MRLIYTLPHLEFCTSLSGSLMVPEWLTWHTVTSVSPTSTGQWLAGAPIETGTDAAAILSCNKQDMQSFKWKLLINKDNKSSNSYSTLHLLYLFKIYNKIEQTSWLHNCKLLVLVHHTSTNQWIQNLGPWMVTAPWQIWQTKIFLFILNVNWVSEVWNLWINLSNSWI